MKIDILLFTQTMHSLLSSFLSLQDALSICSEILTDSTEKKFVTRVLKKVNEGKRFSEALSENKKEFSPLYISLVSIGEDSGTLAEVFGHLCLYLKNKKNMNKKIMQALLYPILVLITVIIVVVILTVFVMPRLEGIFEAFANSSEDIGIQMGKIKMNFIVAAIVVILLAVLFICCVLLRRVNSKIGLTLDALVLKIPVIKKLVLTFQMYDFSFAMKLLTGSHFSLVQGLIQAKEVLGNQYIKQSTEKVCNKIIDGYGVGESFECEKIFPKYLTVWIKIAEENGNTGEAFTQICDYYQNENENILVNVTQAAEPIFTLITGVIIIGIIAQFVIPVFNLLGAL